MALVSRGWWLTVTLADNGDNRCTKTYQLRGADEITAQADATAIRAALNAITNAIVVSYSVSNRYEEDAISFPGAGVEIEDKLSMTCLLTSGSKKANLKVPAPVIGAFVAPTGPSANICDITSSEVADYAGLFGIAGHAYISDGEDLDQLLSGKRVSAKSNKG